MTSSATVALDALIYVGKTTFNSLSGDPTFGTMYSTMVWELKQPFGEFDGINTVYLYITGGPNTSKGLGTVDQIRNPRVRIDILTNSYANSMQVFERLRQAWQDDYNYYLPDGSAGKGYLRVTGRIKNMEISESQEAPWSERGIVWRRIADMTIKLVD